MTVEPLNRNSRFRNCVRLLNRDVDKLIPLTEYADSLGRKRTAGAGRRARARACIGAFVRLQSGARSGVVFAGYEKLGSFFDRSRSTAYRAVEDLVEVGLLERTSGGGKMHDQRGVVVPCANAYRVPLAVRENPVRMPRPRPGDANRRREIASMHDMVDRWRDDAARAPGPPAA